MSDPAIQDARGLILDETRDWTVVSMSFRKFFNPGEPLAAEIDWSATWVEEKPGSSLMDLHRHAGA